MRNELPYTNVSLNFVVMKSPLIGVIPGGILREASRQDTIVLDASSSMDPDYPEYRDFRSVVLIPLSVILNFKFW